MCNMCVIMSCPSGHSTSFKTTKETYWDLPGFLILINQTLRSILLLFNLCDSSKLLLFSARVRLNAKGRQTAAARSVATAWHAGSRNTQPAGNNGETKSLCSDKQVGLLCTRPMEQQEKWPREGQWWRERIHYVNVCNGCYSSPCVIVCCHAGFQQSLVHHWGS